MTNIYEGARRIAFFAFNAFRYARQRLKAINQAYWFIISLEAESKLAQVKVSHAGEQPEHADYSLAMHKQTPCPNW